jgi:6-phosphogluconolactonase
VNVEVEVAPRDALAGAFRERFRLLADAALARQGRFSCALPGGSVAEAFLPGLAEASIDWTRLDLFWGDERAVPPDHADSNYGLARRLLLARVAADPARVHRIPAEAPDLAAAAQGYARELTRALGDPPRLDLVVLGVGPDGHVCSLFPGHPLLAEEARWVAPVFDAPKPPPARITLTLRALAAADVVWVAAFGEAKAEVVRAALEDPRSPLPVARVAREAKQAWFLLDPEAARLSARG